MGITDFFKKKVKQPSPAEKQSVGVYPENWPYELKLAQAVQHFRILRESMDIIGKTIYPETFFSRYKLAEQHARIVVGLCAEHEMGKDASNVLLMLEREKIQIINAFLLRSNTAGKLPFVCRDVEKYRKDIPDECYLLFQSLTKSTIQEDTDVEYCYCSVSFDLSAKTYYYLSDGSIEIGDRVVVPVGRMNEEKVAVVRKVEKYKSGKAPISPKDLKWVVRKLG